MDISQNQQSNQINKTDEESAQSLELKDMIQENIKQMEKFESSDSEDSEEIKDVFDERGDVYEKVQLQIEKHYQQEGKEISFDYANSDRRITSKSRFFISHLKASVVQNETPKDLKGYLQKKSPSFFRGWQDRYVTLKDHKMCYFEKEGDVDPKGVINFDLAKADVKFIDKKTFQIIIEGSERSFMFRSHEDAITEDWVNEIKRHISVAGKRPSTCILNTKSMFWRFDTISEQQFINLADTGDILLFRCKQLGSKITRTFTNSHFDHVAMVLKFETDPDEVYFVESTSNRGVSISRWTMIRKFVGDFYEQVILRHLEVERSDALIDKLEIFLKEAVGNKYGISTSKLLFQRNTVKPKKNKYIDDDRTFFCSELVAKAYKVLGIMEDDGRPSNYFYPASFSSKSTALNLTVGAHLGQEMNIAIDSVVTQQDELMLQGPRGDQHRQTL
ncbi:ph domain containing protein [Stylonychia lemnae]|uniref:Ph domain containing protein n=1 Tax=Stylonychia lemnae TaxID=5949 RepID=A0A078B8N8_STYLE|nr:ph domain containing protein [Stylonychia lemnae]|eukprot:CDW89888.1 ph domain containing protein [Stylonychia lemnae]